MKHTLPEISDKMDSACLVNLHKTHCAMPMISDYYQEVHKTQTFFQKLVKLSLADSLGTVYK